MKPLYKLILAILFFLLPVSLHAKSPVSMPKSVLAKHYGALMDKAPLLFTPNMGQLTDTKGNQRPDILYTATNGNTKLFLSANSIAYQFTKPKELVRKNDSQASKTVIYRFDLQLLGSNEHPIVRGEEESSYKESFYLSSCPKGITGVSTYGRLVYEDVYPGVNWVVYNNGNRMEYDFSVKAGADVSKIRMKIKDAGDVSFAPDGSLVIKTALGEVRQHAPQSYINGKKVASRFCQYADGSIGFVIPSRTKGEAVVIDPSVSWGTYYGGTNTDEGWSVSVSGNSVYLVGQTNSSSGIATTTAPTVQTTLAGGYDAFIVKFDSLGNRVWATYYGGSASADYGYGSFIDNAGCIYVTCEMNSSGMATAGAYSTALYPGAVVNAFLVKFNSTGVRLHATYFGGNANDQGYSCATYGGVVYLAGKTSSTVGIAYSTTGTTIQTSNLVGTNASFLAQFDSTLSTLYWSTYYGGTGNTLNPNIAVDGSGYVYLTGQTSTPSSTSYYIASNPTVTPVYQSTSAGGYDLYLAKFNSVGVRQWGTYFGGGFNDTYVQDGSCISISGNSIYLAGYTVQTTTATNVFTVTGCYQSVPGGAGSTAILAQFNTSGTRVWSTYFGGFGVYASTATTATGCTTDGNGGVYLVGYTTASVATTGGFQTTSATTPNGFIAKFDSLGNYSWSSYYANSATLWGCSSDKAGNLYVGGYTTSTLPTGAGSPSYSLAASYSNTATVSFQKTNGGGTDAFLGRINDPMIVTGAISSTTVTPCSSISVSYSVIGTFGGGNIFTVQLSNATGGFNNGAVNIGTLTASGNGTITATIPTGTAAGSAYAIRIVSNLPVAASCASPGLTIANMALNPALISICSGGTETLTATLSSVGSPQYTWSGPGITGSTVTSTSPLILAPSATGTAAYSVTVVNSSTCTVTAQSASVTITASPTASVTPSSTSVCVNGTETLTAWVSSGGGSTYTWSGPGIAGSTTTTAGSYSVIVPSGGGVYTLSVNFGSGSGCPIYTTTSTSIATPAVQPTVTTTAASTTLCAGSVENLTSSVTGGMGTATYTWSGPGIATTTVTGTTTTYSVAITGATAAAYTLAVSYSVTTGCATATGTTATVFVPTITVTALPTQSCAGGVVETVTPTVINGGSFGTPVSYTWTGPLILGTSVGTSIFTTTGAVAPLMYTPTLIATTASIPYTVTATFSGGCAVTASSGGVTFDSQPALNLHVTSYSVCAGTTDTIYSGHSGGFGAYTYTCTGPGLTTFSSSTMSSFSTWTVCPTCWAFTISPATAATGVYTATLASSLLGCNPVTATSSPSTNIAAQPVVTVTPSVISQCSGGTEKLTAAITGGLGTATYVWSGSDISTTTTSTNSLTFTASTGGIYTVAVSYSVATGCVAAPATTASVVITGAATTATVVPSSTLVCPGTAEVLTETDGGGVGSPTYTWSGPGLSSTTTSVSTFTVTPATSTSGAYSVMVNYSGCTSQASTGTVYIPTISVTSLPAQSCIGGVAQTVTPTITNAGAFTPSSYTWTGPNILGTSVSGNIYTTTGGTTPLLFTPTLSAASAGEAYTVTAAFSGGCSVTGHSGTVAFSSQPATFLRATSYSVCVGATDTLYSSTSGGFGVYTYTCTGPDLPTFSTSAITTMPGFTTCTTCEAFTISPSVPATGLYTVTYTSSGLGCNPITTTSSTTTPTYYAAQPVMSVTPSTTSPCGGGVETLTANITGGTGAAIYTWSGPDITTTTTNTNSYFFNITTGGVYTVAVYYPSLVNTSTHINSVTGCAASPATTDTIAVAGTAATATVTASDTLVCPGMVETLTEADAGGAGTPIYTWSGPGLSSTTTSVPIFTVSPTVSGSGAYTMTVSYSGCASDATTPIVYIPTVTTVVSGLGQLCSGGGTQTLTPTIINEGGSAPVSYTWTGPGILGTSVSPGISTLTGTITPLVFVPTVNSTVNGDYTVTANYAGCSVSGHTPFTTEITSQPQLSCVSSINNLCLGIPVVISSGHSGGVGSYTYTLTGPDLTTVTEYSIGFPTATYSFTPNVATSGVYTATLTWSGLGCIPVTATSSSVTIAVQPTVAVTASATTLCAGATETLTPTINGGAGAAIYTWNGPSITTSTSGAVTIYTVVPSAAGSGAYSLAVAYQASTGCTASSGATSVVTIQSQPTATITPALYDMCTPAVETLTAMDAGGTGTPTYTWSGPGITSGTSTSVSTYSVSISSPVTPAAYSLTVSYSLSGCTATALSSGVFTENQPAVNDYINGGSTLNVCAGTPVTLTTSRSGGAGNATYTWSGPGITGSTSTGVTTSLTVTPAYSGVYSVALSFSVSAGCTVATASSASVTVTAQPSATVTPSLTNLCTGSTETLTAAVSGGAGTPTYTWIGAGITTTTSTGATGSYSLVPPVSTGTYTLAVSYLASTGCAADSAVTGTVTVLVQPTAGLTAASTDVCSGGTETLTATVSGGIGAPVYMWSGPGITVTSGTSEPAVFTPTVSVNTSAAYSVTITYPGTSCAATATSASVNVTTQSLISSVTPSLTSICIGDTLRLTAAGTGGAGSPIYTWSGPGITTTTSSSSSLVFTPNVPNAVGEFSVSVAYSGSGCNSATDTTVTIKVHTQPLVTLSASVSNLCIGALETLTENHSGGAGAVTYTWSGPGIATTTMTSLSDPYTYSVMPSAAASGAYTVTLSYAAGTGCSVGSATSGTVNVGAQPALALSVSPTSICVGGTINISSLVTGGAGSLTYSWGGSGIATTTGSATAPATFAPTVAAFPGTYTVSANYTGAGCIASMQTQTVTVDSNISVSAFNDGPICPSGTVNFSSSVTGSGASAPYTYSWTGDGSAGFSTSTNTVTASAIPTGGTGSHIYTLTVSPSGGCNAVVATTTVTVNNNPNVNISEFPTAICSGSAVLTAGSLSGGAGTFASYLWSGSDGFKDTVTNILTTTVSVTPSATTTYSLLASYTGSGCIGTFPSVSVLTVSATPSIGSLTLTPGTTNLCAGSVLSLTANGIAGGTGATVYTWSGPGIVTATTSVPSLTYTTSTSGSGSYSVTLNSAGQGCGTSTPAYSVSNYTITPQPAVTLTVSATLLCASVTETLTATPSGGTGTAQYTWRGPGISGSAGPYSSPVYTAAPVAGTPAAAYSVTLSYSGSGCNAISNTSSTVTVTTAQYWKGTVSNSWNNAANWGCGTIPNVTQDVVVPGASYYTNAPTLDVSTGHAHNLTVNSTAALTLGSGNQLDVTDTMINNGTISGSGVVYINGSSSQVLKGNGVISNLTLANSASIGTASDTVGITGTLLLNSGTLTTNGALMLVSNSGGSGTIGTITGGAISGNVVMQQYIAGGRRAYRFISHPFSTGVALSQIEPFIDITGTGGSGNGFTNTTTNSPSSYWYHTMAGNSSLGNDPGWVAFSNTSQTIGQYEGARLFVRGSKGEGLYATIPYSYTIDPVIYRTYGTVNTGAQTVTMVKGASSDFNLIGNPYPAVTNIGAVLNAAITAGHLTGAAFYVWDPHMGSSGAFITHAFTDCASYYIGPNESFEVEAASNGATLTYAESNKGTTVSEALMRSAANEYLELEVYDTAYNPWDILDIAFSDEATDNKDARYDALKPPSPASLNFYSWSADNHKLSLDTRPFSEGKVIPLGITSSYAQDFIIRAENTAVPAGGQVYLHDKYLQTYTLLQQGTEYKFSITKEAASQGDQRFELSMKPAAATVIQAKAGMDVQMMPNPATNEVTINYTTAGKYPANVHVTDVSGITVITEALGIHQSGSAVIDISKLASGVYIVEFTSGSDKVVQRLVKE